MAVASAAASQFKFQTTQKIVWSLLQSACSGKNRCQAVCQAVQGRLSPEKPVPPSWNTKKLDQSYNVPLPSSGTLCTPYTKG